MSSRLPVEVNPFRLVEQRAVLDGVMPLKALPRLQELLVDDQESVITGNTATAKVALKFEKTDTGLPVIVGTIETELCLTCQRCLQGLIHPLVTTVETVLVTNDAQAQRLQDIYDLYLVEDDRLFLQDFIEDEILLKLPFSVMHKQCEPVRAYIEALPEDEISQADQADIDMNTEKKAEDNPFASLQELKKDLE